MPDENPPPVFPQYAPPNPNGLTIADSKQQKPLLKIINRMLKPKVKTRVSPVKKKVAKKKRADVGWI